MAKKYIVGLTSDERQQLEQLLSRGKAGVRQIKRAQILLAADRGPIDEAIAASIQVPVATVERIANAL